jgi:hypothetical protein
VLDAKQTVQTVQTILAPKSIKKGCRVAACAQVYVCSGVRVLRCTCAQVYKRVYSGVRVLRCTCAQVYVCSGVRVLRCTSVCSGVQTCAQVYKRVCSGVQTCVLRCTSTSGVNFFVRNASVACIGMCCCAVPCR